MPVPPPAARDAAPAAGAAPPLERVWRPRWPCPVRLNLSILRHGGSDPTFRSDPDGTVWRGIRTPEGPATLRMTPCPAAGTVVGTAWGAGAGWVLEAMPAMLGAEDDTAAEFAALARRHPVLAGLARRFEHWRVVRSGLVMESLVPVVVEQKVTGQEAFAGWRTLVYRFGERAPGAGAARGVWLAPDADAVRLIPSWEWLALHIDPARSRTIVRAAQVASSLERTVGLPLDEVDRRLRSLPGVGVWTSAEVRFRVHGDTDAVSFGDYHIARNTGWALTGEEVDDDGLAELLEPYRPHRYRVQRLVELGGYARPRHGPRMAPRRHLPARPVG